MKCRQIIDSWDKIQMDSTADGRVLEAILIQNALHNKKKGVQALKFPKLVYALSAVLLIVGLATGAVFADSIKSLVATVLSFEDGTNYPIDEIASVRIKDTAVASEDLTPMTIGEVEAMLGVGILRTELASTDLLHYHTGLSGGKIGRVDLWYPGFIDIDDKGDKTISMAVAFLTPYAGEEYVDPFRSGIDASGGKKVKGSHQFPLLGQVTVYGNSWSSTRLNAVFVHDDMLYTLIAENVSEQEMLDIIGSLR